MAAIIAGVAGASLAAGQQPPQRVQGTIQAGATAVLVDVVVRDKRGDVVKDLKQSEVQITEDGVPQAIASFAPVIDGVAGAPAGASGAAPAAPLASRSVGGAAAPVEAGPT